MLYWEQELSGLYFNTDWTDTPKMSIVQNDPDVGLPIVRLRSYSVQHTFTGTIDMSYEEYNSKFVPFVMEKLHGGMARFFFRSPSDSGLYQAVLSFNGGAPYNVKRKNSSLYTVSVTIIYYVPGVIR